MSSKVAREWFKPADDGQQPLVLYNSLLDEKVPFIPAAGANSKQISWYTCGPTVYDATHMGHARNYVTFDIVRRVLEDYFGYNCMFVMNVTDVDDKIILRARRNFLLSKYQSSATDPAEVKRYAESAINASLAKQKGKEAEALALVKAAQEEVEAAGDKKSSAQKKADELAGALKNEEHKTSQIAAALDKLNGLQLAGTAADIPTVLEVASDYIAEALDKEQGASVTDPAIYRAHAAKYEREFFEDMDALGCRRPDVLTRVSEFIPEIVDYVTRIIGNGMAYESNGSVYFDTSSFKECGHTYGKLKPWAVGSAALASEGESNFETSEKRSRSDFALWKAAKPGEPFWASPWGNGRPGWHIECSAMASSVIGSTLDIHTGGEDLKFPHHDNELAQAEAHYHTEGCRQWVNYFLHSGHLNIEGLKMSKSLKNFVTIREALQTFSARQLRLMFVLQPWHRSMMYGEAACAEMKAKEASLKNFFQNVDVVLREVDMCSVNCKWEAAEVALSASITTAQQTVHSHLCDNVNTAAAMDTILDLIKSVNNYLAAKQSSGATSSPLLLRKASAFVTRILSVFGVVDGQGDKCGFTDASSGDNSGVAARYLDAFAAFRDEVRGLAKSKAEPSVILAACDKLRDDAMVELGVRLEDRPDGKAVWKLDDPAIMRAEQAERARIAADAARKKLADSLERKRQELDKFEKLAELPPVEQALADKYSKFDAESGEPTHDKDGNALDGKAKDKAKKDLEKVKKVRAPLEKKLAEDPEFLTKLRDEVASLSGQLSSMSV